MLLVDCVCVLLWQPDVILRSFTKPQARGALVVVLVELGCVALCRQQSALWRGS